LAYVLDVYYTQAPQYETESELVKRYAAFEVERVTIESNSGGKAFGRNVDKMCKEQGNKATKFGYFHQTKNKIARILSNSVNVTNTILMPENWNKLFPEFYNEVTEFQRAGKNNNDDGCDCLTLIAERDTMSVTGIIG
jgi:predicted phage terminase large subunit-like protein